MISIEPSDLIYINADSNPCTIKHHRKRPRSDLSTDASLLRLFHITFAIPLPQGSDLDSSSDAIQVNLSRDDKCIEFSSKSTLLLQLDIESVSARLPNVQWDLLFAAIDIQKYYLSRSLLKVASTCYRNSDTLFLSVDLFAVRYSESFHFRNALANSSQLHELFKCFGAATNASSNPNDLSRLYENSSKGIADLQFRSYVIRKDIAKFTLLEFQADTVNWALRHEGKMYSEELNSIVDCQHTASIPLGWQQVENSDIYVNSIIGSFAHVSDLIPENASSGTIRAKGLIAEEMGLGKTVEVLSLILLNPREDSDCNKVIPSYVPNEWITTVKTTLILSPESILKQWVSEIRRHAPHLKVMVYNGTKNRKENATKNEFAEYDIVVASYAVISREIHYANKPVDRTLRGEKKYIPPRSPLVLTQFWRIILDEVQILESGSTNAAMVASLIPRIHAWGVSGTPARKSLNDLYGIFAFLGIAPYGYSLQAFERLVRTDLFEQFCKDHTIRHSKSEVSEFLRLPVQHIKRMQVKLSSIEHGNYMQLYRQFMTQCIDGKHESSEQSRAEMIRWLNRLRQTCSHAALGNINKEALGSQEIKTISAVLDAMVDQDESKYFAHLRSKALLWIHKGQILEQRKLPKEALETWKSIESEVVMSLTVVQDQLRAFLDSVNQGKKTVKSRSTSAGLLKSEKQDLLENNGESDRETPLQTESEEDRKRIALYRARVRSWQDVVHRLFFFLGTAYFQLEDTENESKYYDLAQEIRSSALRESAGKARGTIQGLQKRLKIHIYKIKFPESVSVGLTYGDLYYQMKDLVICFNRQADLIKDWGEKLKEFLINKLVDESGEANGEEYEKSLDQQEYAYTYLNMLQLVTADYKEFVTGYRPHAQLIEPLTSLQEGDSLELYKELERKREGAQSSSQLFFPTLRDRIRMKYVESKLKADVRQADIYLSESQIGLSLVKLVEKWIKEALESVEGFEKTLTALSDVYNARLEYYKQLQAFSDTVARFEVPDEESFLTNFERENLSFERIIETSRKRIAYLRSLKGGGSQADMDRTCIICQGTISYGLMTYCGHQYCTECLSLWWKVKRTCPVCRTRLARNECYDVCYDDVVDILKTEEISSFETFELIKDIGFHDLRNVPLRERYGAKLDTVVAHVITLKKFDPSAQVVIFSQWSEFLSLLSRALTENQVTYAFLEDADKFTQNSTITCFLLNAQKQSSGLNLVCAKYLILCEPFLNVAFELQAISRIHRIGQTSETIAWIYTVINTVEENVYRHGETARQMLCGDNGDIDDTQNVIQNANLRVNKDGEVAVDSDVRKLLLGEDDEAKDNLSATDPATAT
ncbi:hypothetical protein CANCADRAFT_1516 [Tortispora caseinolytica NRRL Y-17796]|uniref:RING-type domain-containing protein n=1 Tax=Tortispora caseinolytica NRRL Y-17796 TaxID=767744 RepID=A0A1E4TMF5_9ASCO|nr:hypothetical protein CANCADRAFT_1516 [Tortispora caseinolytica NRRL Y-17796]